MKPTIERHVARRLVAALLVPVMTLSGVPLAAQPAASAATAATTVPASFTAASRTPAPSPQPAAGEIDRVRVFAEPLVPTGATTAAENQAVVRALTAYVDTVSPENHAPREAFRNVHPHSPWCVALLTNLGLVAQRTGYFTRATRHHEDAWHAGRDATEPRVRTLAERALSERAALLAGFGRADDLARLLGEVGARTFSGASAERLGTARQAPWLMQNRPELALRCGPVALDHVLAALGRSHDERIAHALATPCGTSRRTTLRTPPSDRRWWQLDPP